MRSLHQIGRHWIQLDLNKIINKISMRCLKIQTHLGIFSFKSHAAIFPGSLGGRLPLDVVAHVGQSDWAIVVEAAGLLLVSVVHSRPRRLKHFLQTHARSHRHPVPWWRHRLRARHSVLGGSFGRAESLHLGLAALGQHRVSSDLECLQRLLPVGHLAVQSKNWGSNWKNTQEPINKYKNSIRKKLSS